jgi:hypothetical protein
VSTERFSCCGAIAVHEEWCPTHIRGALSWIESTEHGRNVRERAETALSALIERDGLAPAVTIPDVLPLARFLYRDASVGCCLHLPLAAGDMDDDSLRRSILAAQSKGHAHCETLARVLLRMTAGQRERVARDAKR